MTVINFDALAENVNRYLVTPLNAFGVGGFVFDVEGDSVVDLKADITDHFLEDNTTIQDHIAIKPKKITLKSYVGELVFRQDGSSDAFAQKVTRKLTILNEYLPELATQAKQIKDIEIDSLSDIGDAVENLTSQTINKTTDYWAFVKNMFGTESRQQQAYRYFKALMEQKLLVSVQTPFEYMNNMAIESITARQPESSAFISDFSITLKEIRTANILNVPRGSVRYVTNLIDTDTFFQGRSAFQNESLDNVGQINGINDGSSISDTISGFLE